VTWTQSIFSAVYALIGLGVSSHVWTMAVSKARLCSRCQSWIRCQVDPPLRLGEHVVVVAISLLAGAVWPATIITRLLRGGDGT
jgi:hypothetical protein